MEKKNILMVAILALCLMEVGGCASIQEREVAKTIQEEPSPNALAPNIPSITQSKPERILKRKIGIGRFSNETRYGAGVFLGLVQTDDGYDRIGKQASDILSSELTKSQKFILLERTDLNKLKAESKLMGLSPEDFSKNLVGVDALILGSVSEFGRKDESDVGLFGRSRMQVAHAKVNIRLVDPRTGYVFFSEDGAADATTENLTTFGVGRRAEFDSTLNDKALSGAIANLIDKIVNKLSDKPWTTGVLRVEVHLGSWKRVPDEGGRWLTYSELADQLLAYVAEEKVFISGGNRQGLRVGDTLKTMVPGETIKSPQTGFDIQLPHTKVGEIEIESFFGDSETNEGSICKILSGPTPTAKHIIQY